MGLKNSYFAIPNPLMLLRRWLNPEVQQLQVVLRGRPLTVSWTARAERRLQQLESPLLAEMQLYFSCVVKKRVLFHQQPPPEKLELTAVGDHLLVAFRAVQSSSCDPVEFAANFPVKQEFETMGAVRMHPSALRIDYSGGEWEGEFSV
jgi:hypothetical protein